MFTGIVEELGRVVSVEPGADESARITFDGPLVTSDARLGDSICVDGVCLTVVDLDSGRFSADLMAETLRRSALGSLAPDDRVNLERSMSAGGRFGGHLVSGHADGVGHLIDRRTTQNWDVLSFSIPPQLSRYLVPQGSITVDGVSLTVVSVQDGPAPSFRVSLVPTTLNGTTLGRLAIGSTVNLEVDMIGKYVERLLAVRQ